MQFDPHTQQAIAAHLQFLRDLGIYDLYRRGTDAIEPAPQEPLIPLRNPIPIAAEHRLVRSSPKPRRSVARDPV